MFWLRFLWLLGCVVAEGVRSAIALAVFPFTRARYRARTLEALRRAAAGTVVCALVLLTGCSPFPGASFQKQVDETIWSAYTLAAMPDWKKSLTEDLETLSDPEWDQLPDTLSMWGW